MEDTSFKVMTVKKIYFIIAIILCLLIGYGIYNNINIRNNKETVIAYAIEKKGFRMGSYNPQWEFIYIYDKKPYFAYITGKGISYGSCYTLNINKNNPSRHNDIFLQEKEVKNKIILWGLNFKEGDYIKIFQDKQIIYEFSININFGVELPLEEQYHVELYREKKYYARYEFSFSSPSTQTFYPIELISPEQKTMKKIFFDLDGNAIVNNNI